MPTSNDHKRGDAPVRAAAGGDTAGAGESVVSVQCLCAPVDRRIANVIYCGDGVGARTIPSKRAFCSRCGRPFDHVCFLSSMATKQMQAPLHGVSNRPRGPEQ